MDLGHVAAAIRSMSPYLEAIIVSEDITRASMSINLQWSDVRIEEILRIVSRVHELLPLTTAAEIAHYRRNFDGKWLPFDPFSVPRTCWERLMAEEGE